MAKIKPASWNRCFRIRFFSVTMKHRVRKRSNCSGEHAKQTEREVDGGVEDLILSPRSP